MKSGRLGLNVFIDNNMTGNKWTDAKLKQYFERISKELYDATERQVQLGKVRIYRAKPGAKNKSDIIFSPNISGAYTYAGNFGQSGVRAKIYATDGALDAPGRATIVHELGHLLFGIYDSYVGRLERTVNGQMQYLGAKSDGTGYEWSSSPYTYNNAHPVPPPDTRNTFFDNTEWSDGSVCCLMDGPDKDETEFSTPAGKGWRTDHKLPYNKNFTWNRAPNGSLLNPPFRATARVLTKQNRINNNESAWETIVRNHSSMVIPIAEPVSADFSGYIAFGDDADDDVKFIVMPDTNEIGVVIDRSGSMSGTPLQLAKSAAALVVNLTHLTEQITINGENITVSGDKLSIASFSSSASVDYAPGGKVAEMDVAQKSAAKQALSAINSGGSTSIGAGLQASLGTFDSDEAPKNIILLSDGEENSAPFIASVQQSLIDKEIHVYTVGLGAGANANKLRDLSNQTKGKFFFASNASQLPGIFSQIYSIIRDEASIRTQAGKSSLSSSGSKRSISAGQQKNVALGLTERHVISPFTALNQPQAAKQAIRRLAQQSLAIEHVNVDSFIGEVTFLVSWDNGTADISLTDPNGQLINAQNFTAHPNTNYIADSGYAIYRIKNPLQGNWQVQMNFTGQNVQWELRTFGIDSVVSCSSQADKDTYTFPDPITIQASCGAPEPVIGGHAWAVVVMPDGTESLTLLYDDGDANHGDAFANDGIYSNIVSATGGSGQYTVTSVFDSTGGTTPDGSSDGIETERGTILQPKPVSPFQRYNQFTFSVAHVPNANVDTDGDGMPDVWEAANQLNPTDPSDATQDPDQDGLNNLAEYQNNTNPNLSDTDNDGYSDGEEVAASIDPLDPNNFPHPNINREAKPVPTFSDWAVITLGMLLGIFSWRRLGRKQVGVSG